MSESQSGRLRRLVDLLIRRLVDLLIRHRIVLLSAVIILTLLAWSEARKLEFDQSIESLYADNDPHLDDYLESKQLFGGDEFVIVAYDMPDLFQPYGGGLSSRAKRRLEKFSTELSAVPGVKAASTQNLADALKFPLFRRRVRELVERVLVGEDDRTTAIVLRLIDENEYDGQIESSDQSPELSGWRWLLHLVKGDETESPRAKTIRRIRDIAAKHNRQLGEFEEDEDAIGYVVGEPVQIHDMFRIVEEDGRKLFLLSFLLLAIVIFLFFRSLRWVVLPLIVVIATITWTEALLVVLDFKLSMVSSMLNSLATIISIATVTHVTVHFRELRKRLDRTESLRQTLIDLLPAVFWTCATTAVGFGALLSSHITPVQSFGIMMALAAGLVLITSAAVLPGGILLGKLSADPKEAPAEQHLVRALTRLTVLVERHPKLLGGIIGLVTVFSAFGFYRLDIETDFSKNFRDSSEIVKSLDFVETRLGGAGNWEVNFSFEELSTEELDRVRKVAEKLRELVKRDDSSLTKVVCLTDGIDMFPWLPFIANTPRKRLDRIKAIQPEFESTLYNAEKKRMRIVLRARERQSAESKNRLIKEVEDIVQSEFPDAKATGVFVLLTFIIQSLLSDQLVSFLLAATGIGLMMMIAFRSVLIGLISLIPNVFPIVLLIGMMGWSGVPVNIGTAMIASVSMGLTVDSSVHYISGYRRARRQGLNISDALAQTHGAVGRALVFATLALIVGFSVLTGSQFIPLVYFGILVSIAMLGGLIGNLVLLPLLLRWADRDGEGRW